MQPPAIDSVISSTEESLSQLEPEQQLQVISKLFQEYALVNSSIVVPSDFLALSVKAMYQLKEARRTNVIYNMTKAIGTKRTGSNESRLPVTRMPMGLLEYCANFYSASSLQKVTSVSSFVSTMFSL